MIRASWVGIARVWDARNGSPLSQPLKVTGALYTAQFSADGLRVVTCGVNLRPSMHGLGPGLENTARVWDTRSWKPLTEPLRHEAHITFAAFSPDGLKIVTVASDKKVRVWDAFTGLQLGEAMRHDAWVESAEFSPDSLKVVTASQDRTARVWDASTGQALTEPLPHQGWVRSARFFG